MIGARGRNNDAAALAGSVNEQVIRSARIPIMVVNKEGEGLRLFDAFIEL